LLKRVQVQQEAERANDGQGVDRPVRQDAGQPGTRRGHYELDQERGGSVADSAGQCQGEGPDVVTAPGHEEASADGDREPCGERQNNEEADAGMAAGRPRDSEETGQAHGSGDHPADQYRVEAVPQQAAEQDREDEIADQQGLHEGKRSVPERKDLQREADDGPRDGRQP
jgi:hypothetical protein